MKSLKNVICCFFFLSFFFACTDSKYKMETSVMEPALKKGQVLHLKEKTIIQRNDIVAFRNAASSKVSSNTTWVFRAVGLPGDTVRIVKGELFVNGAKSEFGISHPAAIMEPGIVQEDIFGSNVSNNWNQDNFGPLLVPKTGEKISGSNETVSGNLYFVMGDNRSNAYDSRFFGFVSEDEILGVVD